MIYTLRQTYFTKMSYNLKFELQGVFFITNLNREKA